GHDRLARPEPAGGARRQRDPGGVRLRRGRGERDARPGPGDGGQRPAEPDAGAADPLVGGGCQAGAAGGVTVRRPVTRCDPRPRLLSYPYPRVRVRRRVASPRRVETMADKRTILIVDDDQELSDGLRAVLEKQGFRVL